MNSMLGVLASWREANTRRGWRVSVAVAVSAACLGLAPSALAGSYRDSAHGDPVHGVNRSSIDLRYEGYATGNCAHCHEMHASLEGSDPAPVGGPAPHALFAPSFNTGRTRSPYVETDNFCFHCHSEASGQQVVNRDYSAAFGGAAVSGPGPQSIFAAFNQASYHNLADIRAFLLGNSAAYPWFQAHSNPCSACHNPHLAKRNSDSAKPGFPLLSAISRPDDRSRLWGEAERMSGYSSYEAPYAFDTAREPAGVGDADGGNTPDYVGFCTACHNDENTIGSTTLGRSLRRINWRTTGVPEIRDTHGAKARDSQHPDATWGQRFAEPYHTSVPFKSNIVLSCLDCHEPHGSENIMLLRRRVNGGDLSEPVTAESSKPLLPLCTRCHVREYVNALHHEPGLLAPSGECTACHPGGGEQPEVVACRQCHFHGSNL